MVCPTALAVSSVNVLHQLVAQNAFLLEVAHVQDGLAPRLHTPKVQAIRHDVGTQQARCAIGAPDGRAHVTTVDCVDQQAIDKQVCLIELSK